MFAAVDRDGAVLGVPRAAAARRIQEHDVLVCLEDAGGRARARQPQRLTEEQWIVLIGPHVQLLHLVPILRFVDWPVQIQPRRELAILGLIGVVAAVDLGRPAAARRELFSQLPRLIFDQVATAGPRTPASPRAAEIRPAVGKSRRRHRAVTAGSVRLRDLCGWQRAGDRDDRQHSGISEYALHAILLVVWIAEPEGHLLLVREDEDAKER